MEVNDEHMMDHALAGAWVACFTPMQYGQRPPTTCP